MRLTSIASVAVAAIAVTLAPAVAGATGTSSTLVELLPAARCTEAVFVTTAGGRLIAPTLGLYLVPGNASAHVTERLRARKALRFSTPNRTAGTLAVTDFADPLVPTQWWRAAIGVDTLTPPPAGRPLTIIDSGMDVSHPEFLGRPNTEMLNAQEPPGIGGEHGTSVASLIAAPVNGVGLVGIYPDVLFRSWDAATGRGTQLETYAIVQGVLAAASRGPGVINLSLGSSEKDPSIEQAIYEAIRKGSLVVAASGNGGDEGNALGYPAGIPHVLTVGASDRGNGVVGFSGRSRYVDIVAPGVDMPIATAIGKGWKVGDGTSFASPLVAGAAAWVWTVRPTLDAGQLFEIMRRSATDIGPPGRDDASGFGLLNVRAALSYPAQVRDPFEPNDDVEFVRPDGFYDTGIPALTSPLKRTIKVQARLDREEDPSDVYRIWLPKNGRVTARLGGEGNVALSLWKQGTVSVQQRVAGTSRLASAGAPGTTQKLTFTNNAGGRFAYLAVTIAPGTREARYLLRVS